MSCPPDYVRNNFKGGVRIYRNLPPSVCVSFQPIGNPPCISGATYNSKTGMCSTNPSCPTGTTFNTPTNTCESRATCNSGEILSKNGRCLPNITSCPSFGDKKGTLFTTELGNNSCYY